MIENNPSNVVTAFEILLEEVEAEIEFINRVGSKAFERRDYARAREALDRANQVVSFRDKVVSLRQEWNVLILVQPSDEEDENERIERRNLGRLGRG